jgi:hypothetical protein
LRRKREKLSNEIWTRFERNPKVRIGELFIMFGKGLKAAVETARAEWRRRQPLTEVHDQVSSSPSARTGAAQAENHVAPGLANRASMPALMAAQRPNEAIFVA